MEGQSNKDRSREVVLDLSAGLVSGLMYLSYVLSFGFLIPVQQRLAGNGRKSGMVAGLVALAVVMAGQAKRLFQFGEPGKTAFLAGVASIVLPPFFLLAALFFIDIKAGKTRRGTRILLATLVVSLIATPLILRATSDGEFSAFMTEYMGSTFRDARILPGAGEADTNALIAEAVDGAIRVVRSAYAVFILWIIGGSWWLGTRLAALRLPADAPDRRPYRLAAIKVPAWMLWPTLGVWAALFLVLVTDTEGLPAMAAWNAALCSASVYAVQGLGIISYLSRLPGKFQLLRLVAPLVVLALALSSTAGLLVLIALPLLGITEVWFPYRNLKGAIE
jgi:hypothetical protein